MAYESMEKIFYKNPDQYEEIYLRRLNSESCYNYDFHIGKRPAFVLLDKEVLTVITNILRLNTKLVNLCKAIPGVALMQFVNSCIVDEVKLTNEIEGIHSTRKEIQSIMNEKVKERKENRLKGLVDKYVLLLTSEVPLELISCEQVRELYDEIVLPEIKESEGYAPDGGIFRKEGVDVLSKSGKVIHSGSFPEDKVVSDMKKALDILNSDDEHVEPLINIAVFHYLFGYIHPFYDGNGRMTRFISSSFLARHLGKIVGLGLSYTIKENISNYYHIFKTTNDPRNRGDMTYFVIQFLKFLQLTMTRIIKEINEKGKRLEFYYEKIQRFEIKNESTRKIFQIILQATLFSEEEGVSIKEMSDYCECSETTVRAAIKQISKNNLVVDKRGYTNYYTVNLSVLDDL